MANNENTELAVQENYGFLALANTDFATDIGEVLDGLGVTFGKIKISAGEFEVPNEDGGADSVKEYSAVILTNHPVNMYYKSAYNGGSAPPDCGSFDGKIGIGDPGGECEKCHLNQFNTAVGSDGKPGKGKACKNRQRVYVLREGELFPMVFGLPTGSLTTFRAFLLAQLSKGRKPWHHVTKFSIKKAISSEGKPYSQVSCKRERVLTAEEIALTTKLSEQVKEFSSKNTSYDFDEADGSDEAYVDPETGEVIEPLGGTDV